MCGARPDGRGVGVTETPLIDLPATPVMEAKLGKWGPGYIAAMDRMRKLVCQFYDGLNFGKFVREHPDRKGLITDVLIGDLFKPDIDALWPLMDEMQAAEMAAKEPAVAG